MFVCFTKNGHLDDFSIYINPANVDYVEEIDDYKRKCRIKMSGSGTNDFITICMPTHEVIAILNGEKVESDFIDEFGDPKFFGDEFESDQLALEVVADAT